MGYLYLLHVCEEERLLDVEDPTPIINTIDKKTKQFTKMLDVSRKDIEKDAIMEFDSTNRFIKLPIDSYLELLGITPNTAQMSLINAINNPKYRFICAAISRRRGKTYITNVIGQLVSLVPTHIY